LPEIVPAFNFVKIWAAKRIYKTANGTVSFSSVKSQRLGTDVGMMTIEKNGITNGYLFGLTPYDKPTLKQ